MDDFHFIRHVVECRTFACWEADRERDMSEQWLTIAEAAAAMKVHPRTVERRIAAGKVDSRRNDDGQVEILIDLPGNPPRAAVEVPPSVGVDPLETVREMADRQVDIAAGTASALVRVAREQAMRAEHELTLARQDVTRYRRDSQMALALVAVMTLLIVVAVAWGTAAITNARADARSYGRMTAAASESARVAQSELETARKDLNREIVDRAKAQGALDAYHSQTAGFREPAAPPSNVPSANVLDRVASWFTGDRSR